MTALLLSGALCGVLDISAAFIVSALFLRSSPVRVLQGIAAGLLGPRALSGGAATALLGLVCHFVIAFSAAGVYIAAGTRLPWLLGHPWISGALYGVAVFFFMNAVVVPLSAAKRSRVSMKVALVGLFIHILCVGLPIALAVSWCRSEAHEHGDERNLAQITADARHVGLGGG